MERKHSHGMLTYKYWPMTSSMDFSFMSFAHSWGKDSYIANQIAASVIRPVKSSSIIPCLVDL